MLRLSYKHPVMRVREPVRCLNIFCFRMLCQVRVQYKRSFLSTGFSEGTRNAFFLGKIGAGDGIRTRNPQLGKLMRYRCATPAQVEEKKIN